MVPGGSKKTEIQIAAGAISVFLGWINVSLFLKRFSLFGIYIIMVKRVVLTVCKVYGGIMEQILDNAMFLG